jgi:hypothetical protein
MTSIEAQFGMNDVNPSWNGLSMAYEVSFDDGFGYKNDENEKYAVEVQVPGLCGDRRSDAQVVQDTGEASFELPPCAPGTGLRMPRVPNPYSCQRDASYDLMHDYHTVEPVGWLESIYGYTIGYCPSCHGYYILEAEQ